MRTTAPHSPRAPQLFALGLSLLLLLSASPAVAKKAKQTAVPTEKFFGNAFVMGSVAGSGTFRVEIAIWRWTTDEERQELFEVLDNKGSRKLPRALRKQESCGYVRTPHTLAWDLRYAREIREGDKRTIVLATDRPVLFGEMYRSTRSLDYNTTLILLEVDEEGKGEGKILAGAEISYDPETNTLTTENFGFRPVDVKNLKKRP